jgi:nucleotide-binding universal stress UspA family protein
MHAWKHVFVHVDARPHAGYALGKALSVAEAFGGRVTAFDSVSAVERWPSFSATGLRPDRMLELAATARTYELQEELARLRPRVPVDATVVKGLPYALLRHAENHHADLILKAVSAADLEQGTSAGTATLRLLREALVPVWVCSPHRRRTSRVLTVVNFASANLASERAVRAGARVAALQGAELHVLCVDQQASRHVRELERPTASVTHALSLQIIEKAVLDLEPDIVVLSRDGSELSGLPGTHLVERLFCRVECSMLLLPPGNGMRHAVEVPFEHRFVAPRQRHHAHAVL